MDTQNKTQREIKFRAKRIDIPQWVYGFYYCKYKQISETECDAFCFIVELYIEFEIDIKTLGQYTGLKDKNGKEIYEGDIVTNTIKKLIFICPRKNNKCYYRKQVILTSIVVGWNEYWGRWDIHKDVERGELEVIGNIYENPNLIK